METGLLSYHAEFCGRSAVHVCAGCQRHYCGEHFLRAFFSGPGLTTPVAFDTCQACLTQTVTQQQSWGRKLSYLDRAN